MLTWRRPRGGAALLAGGRWRGCGRRGFGGGEGGAEGGPAVLGEDLLDVARQDLVQGGGVPVHDAVRGPVPGECGETGGAAWS
ncbi:hypothetical protein Scani_48360 [Streptomyces caniferus]|uniref:Uncharacterized protein n=1 Tax=Streptomyces caniferus TaxID=285557 RepID=A0A640SC03_9ACTN|nr:hypothetical protein Scani_48360 [Streptomyces caniferus]